MRTNLLKTMAVLLILGTGLAAVAGDWPARNIDLSVAGLGKGGQSTIQGYVQRPGVIWLLFHGAWAGVVRYDVKEARVTGAVKLPWPDGGKAGIAGGSQQMAVTRDAVWCLMYGQLWRLPKTAFKLPASTEVVKPVPGLTSATAFVLVDEWIYWVTESGAIWRMRHAAGKPKAAAECVADFARVGGPGPLDGGLRWWPNVLVADPARHRVLWVVNEPSPNPPQEEGPRNGIWSHQVATGRFAQVVAARFPDAKARISTVSGDRWVYTGDSFVYVAVDLSQDRVAYGLAMDPPFSWKHPGDQQVTQTPNIPLAVPGPVSFDAWTKPCFTVAPAAPDAFLLFTPRGDGVRVRVFTPTTCLAEVKNDARLLDQMVNGAWWTPRGILVAAVPERTAPMKLWLYETAARPATAP